MQTAFYGRMKANAGSMIDLLSPHCRSSAYPIRSKSWKASFHSTAY